MLLWAEAARRLSAARKAGAVDNRDLLGPFLAARRLIRPHGQPLHRYRTTAAEFEALHQHLAAARKLKWLEKASPRDAAMFVLYGAEWFRRTFAGGIARWVDLTDGIGEMPYLVTTALAKEGLDWWKRPVRKLSGAREWLVTLQLEGGFPSRLLESRDRGWLASHLRKLIASLASSSVVPSQDDVIALAGADPVVRATFRTPDFHALCAELALAVASLRRERGPVAAAAGLRLSAWLDSHEPTWRTDLGIEGEAASRLIDDLVSDSLNRLGGSARCSRLLIKTGSDWRPALQIGFEGEPILPAALRSFRGRLHGYASGHLADVVNGPLCILEPDDEGRWISRPRIGAPREPIVGFPMSKPVTMEMRSDGRVAGTLTWGNGEAVRADVLTFVTEDDAGSEPGQLTLVATGSCRNKRPALYVMAPASYVATDAASRERVEPIWAGPGNQLLRLTATTHVGAPAGELFYRIEPAADGDEADRLSIKGAEVPRLATVDGDVVFAGVPAISAQAGSVVTQRIDDIVWRPVGEKPWRELRRERIRPGTIEVMWRDPASRAARDKRRISILPEGAAVRREAAAHGGARFRLEGAPGWCVASSPNAKLALSGLKQTDDGGTWEASWHGAAERTADFRLHSPHGASIDIAVPFPFGTGCFLRADGTAFRDNDPVVLDRLRGARAVADGRAILWIEVHGPVRGGTHHWAFEDEMPMWGLRDALASLLAEASDIDSEAWVGFQSGGARLRVKRHELDIRPVADGIKLPEVPSPPEGGLTMRWRSLIDMGADGGRDLAAVPRDALVAGGTIAIPDDLPGPGVVFLAEGVTAVSRPLLISRHYLAPASLRPLMQAVLIGAADERAAMLDAALSPIGAGSEDCEPDLRWLHAHLSLPEALTPSTFHAISALVRHPYALAALVASAPDDEARERVWGLERKLPIVWTLTRVDAWRSAFTNAGRRMRSMLERAGFGERAEPVAAQHMRDSAEKFVAFDETLRVPLYLAGIVDKAPDAPRRHDLIAQDYIRRLADGVDVRSPMSCFHTAAMMPQLRPLCGWLGGFDASHHEALEAPIVAALHAAGRASGAGTAHKLRIRQAIMDDPQHFAEAYGAALFALARGNPA